MGQRLSQGPPFLALVTRDLSEESKSKLGSPGYLLTAMLFISSTGICCLLSDRSAWIVGGSAMWSRSK